MEMKAVEGVELRRYMGRWYEIACFPSRFQPHDGVNTRATYSLDDQEQVRVLNETWCGGKRSFIQGVAFKPHPDDPQARLKVKFWVPPFLPLFPVVGDYWILHLDPDYQYALVGQPSRRYLWVLCRHPLMEDAVYMQLLDKATQLGYDVSKLVKTPQTAAAAAAAADDDDDDAAAPQDTNTDSKGFWWLKSIFPN